MPGIRRFIDEDPETYFIGNGDLIDAVIASDLKRYRKSSDGTTGDDIVDQQIMTVVDILIPHKERIIGLGCGNHEDEITKRCGTNPMARICDALGVKFLGYDWLLKIVMSENNARGRSVVFRGHHGWGGGCRSEGGEITKYSRDMAYWDADVFIYGHGHKLDTHRFPRLGISGNKLISKPKIMCLCGSFLKTFSSGVDPSYSEKKGFPPLEMGGLTIKITPDANWVKLKIDI
jgi:hypothetical protein